ncbi:MAG: ComEA family DNA-binding protein [Gemmatimonadota bacterium]
MSPSERRALLLVAGLAVAGHGLKAFLLRPDEAPGGIQLLSAAGQARPAGSALAHRDSILRLSRPLTPGETVDLDRAGWEEIARLPRVGPRLAKAIVEDREAKGPFGSLVGLDRVPGVGPGLLAAVRDHARFSGVAVTPRVDLVDLNTAKVEDLERLPGIGRVRARAIVAFRETHGRFARPEELQNVPGLAFPLVARLLPYVTAR